MTSGKHDINLSPGTCVEQNLFKNSNTKWYRMTYEH